METLFRRKVDVCCVQETRYRGGNCRTIKGKDTRYKLCWSRNDRGTAGVGVFVAEEWIEKVFEVQRVSNRIILVKLIVRQRVVTFLSVYAPQSGLSKDLFFDQLHAVAARIPGSEFLIPCGDWNGSVGYVGTGYREVHGGMGYGRPEPDVESERTLEYALAFNLLLGNTCFKKRDSHLVTYKLGNVAMQIDFILFRRPMRKLVADVKVIPGKEVALQHQLLVCDMRIDVPPKSKSKFTPCLKVWMLKDPQTSNHFQEVFNLHVSAGVADAATEDIWNNIKTGLLKTTEEVCGTTRSHETWWWNEHVEKAIAAKQIAFKAWKTGKGTRASYDAARRIARHTVHHARQCAEPCPCWGGIQWRVWSEGRCSPRLGTQPAALHHCAWSLVTRVPLWGPLGGPLFRWPCYHRWNAEEYVRRLLTWKEAMEEKGLRVNAGKMKIMICGTGLDLLQSSGEFPYAICCTGVGSNGTFCNCCKYWVHKKCSGLKPLTKDPD